MNTKSAFAVAALGILGLLASAATFAHTKAEINASADWDLKHF
jgi:hypothetical protein